MKKLVSTAKMSREEWLQWRTCGIGGSDASIIAGVNPYTSVYQLWQYKTGRGIPKETENEYIHFGTILEPVIKKEFTARTGLKVRNRKAIYQSDEHPFMIADLDGVVNDHGEMCVFEAKTASAYKLEVWEKGVPLEYMYQIQHYLAVTGWKRAYIAALIGGNHFIYHVIERDEALIDKIIQMEREFWERYVLPLKEPPMDGAEATSTFLNETFNTGGAGEIKLPDEALGLCETYDTLTQQIDGLKAQKEEVINKIKYMLKNHEEGIIGDRKVTWKIVRKTVFDQKRLEKEKKDIYDAYCKSSQYRRFNVA